LIKVNASEGYGLRHRQEDGAGDATAIPAAGEFWLQKWGAKMGGRYDKMAVSGVFSGAALTAIDEKGRVAIAASLRNSIPGDGKSRQIYIATHPDSPCLVISGDDRLERIAAEIDRDEELAVRRGADFNRSAERRRRYGAGETTSCDASGRFILPPTLHELGDFEGETQLFLFGVGEYIELWPVSRLLAQEGEGYADAKRAANAVLRISGQRK
jgi:MraZ protein